VKRGQTPTDPKLEKALDDKRARKTPKNDRAADVVLAAYTLIADKGMEGLRTRDVALKAGINSATLHYYFPTKESLVQGVVEHLMRELMTNRAQTAQPKSALELLRAEFSDVRLRLKQSPDQLVVLTELAVRARRDPIIAQMLQYLDQGWRSHLFSVLEMGVADGTFRSDLNIGSTAELLMSQLRGLGFQGEFDFEKLDDIVMNLALETEHWVLAPRVTRKSGSRRS
jgi:AcrR family transcriptional regulator